MQRHAFESATTLSSEPRSRMIDENPPHQARSHAKEVGPVAPVELPLIDQSQVGFVHQGGWLQRLAGYLMPQLCASDTSQMVVDNRDEPVQGVSFAIADGEQKVRDFGRVRFAIRHPGKVRIGHSWGAAQEESGRDATGAPFPQKPYNPGESAQVMPGALFVTLAGGSTQSICEKHAT
jgi:hypothetical protein